MKNEQNAPKIRFKGFTDAWELREFDKIFFEYSEKNHEELPPLTIIQGKGTILRDESDRNLIYDKSGLKNYKLVNKNDFILHLRSFEGGLEMANSCGIVSPAYHIFHGEKIDPRFYYPFFRSKYFIAVLLKPHVYGIRDGKSIDVEGMKSITIPYPSLEEQTRIGQYFEQLDHLITLHQRKCETLQKLKKSMLQKMFPKNGSCFPEIRFAGFTDAWEQRKFSDFTFPAGERNKDDLDLEPFAITSNQGFIAQSEAHDDFGYMKDVDRKMYIVVKPNSFAYNPARINVGSLGYYEGAENVIVSSLYEVFQTAEYVDDKFLKHWFKTKAFQDWIERLQEGSVRLYFYYDKLCECIMSMPSVEEQRKIGAYLDKIDNLITLHQRKLETLKKLKKAMLQKMFI